MIGKAYEQNDDGLIIPVQDFGIGRIKDVIAEPLKTSPMKPFNLEAAKSGKKVITRDGRAVRIVCSDKEHIKFPIVALVTRESGAESTESYTGNGQYYYEGQEHPDDLFMASETVVQWANIYHGNVCYTYDSKEQADASADSPRLACVRIEYEI